VKHQELCDLNEGTCLTSDIGGCTQCNVGYFLASSECHTCHSSIRWCDECSQDGSECFLCADGWRTSDSGDSCIPDCPQDNCQVCQVCEADSQSCLKCASNFQLNGVGDCECNHLEFLSEEGSYPHCESCALHHHNCLTCGDGSECILCEAGYEIEDGECKSVHGCLEFEDRTCTRCETNMRLDWDGNCVCLDGMTFENGACQCSIGSFLKGSICEPCDQGCAACDSNGCVECDEKVFCDLSCDIYDYTSGDAHHCVESCPAHSYQSD